MCSAECAAVGMRWVGGRESVNGTVLRVAEDFISGEKNKWYEVANIAVQNSVEYSYV